MDNVKGSVGQVAKCQTRPPVQVGDPLHFSSQQLPENHLLNQSRREVALSQTMKEIQCKYKENGVIELPEEKMLHHYGSLNSDMGESVMLPIIFAREPQFGTTLMQLSKVNSERKYMSFDSDFAHILANWLARIGQYLSERKERKCISVDIPWDGFIMKLNGKFSQNWGEYIILERKMLDETGKVREMVCEQRIIFPLDPEFLANFSLALRYMRDCDPQVGQKCPTRDKVLEEGEDLGLDRWDKMYRSFEKVGFANQFFVPDFNRQNWWLVDENPNPPTLPVKYQVDLLSTNHPDEKDLRSLQAMQFVDPHLALNKGTKKQQVKKKSVPVRKKGKRENVK